MCYDDDWYAYQEAEQDYDAWCDETEDDDESIAC